MSSSTSWLRIRAGDTAAQIKVLDSSANVVAKGVHRLDEQLQDGFYKIRVRVGSETEERLVALDASLPEQSFARPDIPTPIPFEGSTYSHEYHQDMVREAWDTPTDAGGQGAHLLLSAREWSPAQNLGHPDPAGALALIFPDGKSLPFAHFARVRTAADACAIGRVKVNPGLYCVELKLPDGTRLRRALYASANWTTQLYMLFRDQDGQRVPDLAGGSVTIAGEPAIASDESRLTELAVDALVQHREIMGDDMRAMLASKFFRPLLGILCGHLLLRDPGQKDLLGIVVDNLLNLLGPEHPDVASLCTKVEGKVPSVSEPPMLRASWDLLIEASAGRPDLILPDSPAAKVAPYVVPSAAWLVWQPPADAQDTSRVDAKLEVLRSYIEAQSKVFASSKSVARDFAAGDADDPALDSRSLSSGTPGLDKGAFADLTRALGVPRQMLDGMLKSLR
jgi:hypothetical protein